MSILLEKVIILGFFLYVNQFKIIMMTILRPSHIIVIVILLVFDRLNLVLGRLLLIELIILLQSHHRVNRLSLLGQNRFE
jgi:hypothetical protein